MKNKVISYMKGLAIFSVVCAHCADNTWANSPSSLMIYQIMNYIGTFGVPAFFIISGFLFEGNTKGFKEFWKHKIINIVIPWLFVGSLLWVYIVIRKGGWSFGSWLKYILGVDSLMYYLTMLMVMYIVFWKLKHTSILVIAIAVSVLAPLQPFYDRITYRVNLFIGTPYLNPLFWIGFFALGILAKRYKWRTLGFEWFSKTGLLIVSTVYFIVMHKMNLPIWYFSKAGFAMGVVNATLLYFVAKGISSNVLEKLGDSSYQVYLFHAFFVGLVGKVIQLTGIYALNILKPIVVLLIAEVAIMIIEKLLKKSRLKMLFGIR